MSDVQVLGILCSARRDKNTGSLVKRVLEGAKSAGLSTKLLRVSDYDVRSCIGCKACASSGICAIADEMGIFYDALKAAKVVVWGTPIYFDHITSQAKTLVDRLYAFHTVKRLNGRGIKAVLALTWESGPGAYQDVARWLREWLQNYHDIRTMDVLEAPFTDRHPVAESPDLMDRAYEVGQGLTKHLK
jgi:multimeric flavodoxin WrbA